MKKGKWNFPRFLACVLATQAVAGITLILDIPFARQISGFLFLTFIPGFILLRILGHERPNVTETVLFSVGLSLVFLMLIGFLINELGSFKLISKPLSTEPLAIIINVVVALMCFASYLMNKEDFEILDTKGLRLLPLMFCLVLPLLTVIGVLLSLSLNNNLLLISVVIVIPIIFVSSVLTSKLSSHYPLIIVSIALALLLGTTLTSRYMYGDDIAVEYNVFKETQNVSSLDWQPGFYEQLVYKSMMSDTILPTVFSNLLNTEGGWIFKIVFPIIFSLVPLGLFQLYQIHLGKKVAFLSVIFFMANYEFFQTLTTNVKPMIAELFYVLLFLAILKESVNHSRGKGIIIMFLVFGLIVSHYSLNYMFLSIILLTTLCAKIFLKKRNLKVESSITALSLCLTFLWYMNMTSGPFERFVETIRSIFNSFLRELFYAGSRGNEVQAAVGIVASPTALHNIGRTIHNITSLLILVGFISLLVKWRRGKMDSEYALVTSIHMGFLLSAIIVPRFAGFLEMARTYHFALLFVAPLLVLGAETLFMSALNLSAREIGKKISNPINQKKKNFSLILTSIILVAFFLFQTGLVYEVAGDPVPSSVALSNYKMRDSFSLIHESDVFSATWLCGYGDVRHMWTYTDTVSLYHVLTSYSSIDRRMLRLVSNFTRGERAQSLMPDTITEVANTSYIYLRRYNVEKGRVVYDIGENIQYKISELPVFSSAGIFINRIYSNSASEIYYSVPK